MKKQSVKKWFQTVLLLKKTKSAEPKLQIQVQHFMKKQEAWTEAQAEIINQLINMDSLMKISKQVDEQQYTTLSTINEVLCNEIVDEALIKKCLLGGLQTIRQDTNMKYTTKQLPFQNYSVRSLLWKICLGYLSPSSKQKWVSYMEKNLSIYKKYMYQFIIQPIQKKLGRSVTNISENQSKGEQKIEEKPKKDHPLNFSQESKWGSYFKDVELWNVIEKDVKRTRKTCKFFDQTNKIEFEFQNITLKPEQITYSEVRQQTYADSLTRIIFIYLKNHPNQVYCQGMNQIAALIYYSFTNKNSEYFRRVSQSDSYFAFEIIMNRLPKKHFQKGDEYVKELSVLMKKLDLRLTQRIEKNKGAQMLKLISMKWFLSGFLTEFPIDQSLVIWDVFIAWPAQDVLITECFMYMALALIHLNRQKLVSGENIGVLFSKITNSCNQVSEKTLNLYKLFPKILQK